jgi:uncharacterized glyoxalase superfamily metalloenzyme YdcJ
LAADADLETFVAQGVVQPSPITYEDFLPVSAAGIFQSNLGDAQQMRYEGVSSKAQFEAALGGEVLDEFALYEEQERASIAKVRLQLAMVRISAHRGRHFRLIVDAVSA